MPALRWPPTAGTSPHFHIKPADDGHPHDILFVLRCCVPENDGTLAVGTAPRKGHRNLLVHLAGNRSRSLLSVNGARLASRRLRVGLGISLRKTARHLFYWPGVPLPIASSSAPFLPMLAATPLQRLHSPFEFLFPIRGATVIGRLHPFDNDINIKICPAPCLNTLCLLSCPLVNIVPRLGWEAAARR